MKTAIQYSLIGMLLGLSFSYTLVTISTLLTDTSMNGSEMLAQYSVSLILGIGCGLISLLFTMEKFTFTQKLVIHYISILLLVLLCGVIGNWYTNPVELLKVILIQIVIYAIVWWIIYRLNMKDVAYVNKMLHKNKS